MCRNLDPTIHDQTTNLRLVKLSKKGHVSSHILLTSPSSLAPRKKGKQNPFLKSISSRSKLELLLIEKMEEDLIKRLEAAVTRLEGISSNGGGVVSLSRGGDFSSAAGIDIASSDPSILAYEDLISQCVGRALTAAEKIGGPVLDVTKIVAEAFASQKELLVRIKQTQVSF